MKRKKFSPLYLVLTVVSLLAMFVSLQSMQNTNTVLEVAKATASPAVVATLPTYFSQSAVLYVSVNGAASVEGVFVTQAFVVNEVPQFQVNMLAIGTGGDFIYYSTPIGEVYGYHHVSPKTGLSGSITIDGVFSELVGDITVTNDSILVNAKVAGSASDQPIVVKYKIVGSNPEKKVDPLSRFSTPSPKV